MITKQLSLFALMLSCIAFSQSNPHQSAQRELSNDLLNSQQNNYQRIRINNVNENTMHKLQEIGIDMSCGAILENNQLTIELFNSELDYLQSQDINYTVLINNMQKYYSDRSTLDLPFARSRLEQEKVLSASKSYSVDEIINNTGQYNECDEIDWAVPVNWNLNPNNSPNSFGGCLTYDMVLQELDDMRSLYPNLISVKTNASPTNQTTIEGRTVYYVRISDNPDIDESGEPETLYQSLIHSREAASVMQLLYYMWYILENYNTDTAIKNLVDNQALYFIPVFNPDGFVYNQTVAPNGGGGQRKNRNTSAPGSCSTYLDGIDLNRNSAYYWGNGGSSTNPCSDTYLGTAPFSENETQIMRDFFLQHDFGLALNHHSFKNAMLHAYAGTNITNPRPDEYSKYNHDMTYYNRYAHGPSTSISSLNSGNMNDWMLGGPAGVSANGTPTGTGSGKNTMAWTPENGTSGEGGFWPSPSNFLPIAKRAMRMNFLAAYFSGKYAKLHDLNQSDFTSVNGNFQFAIERLGQTDGDFTLEVTPVSPNILTIGGPVTQTGMSVLQQNNVNISYTLDPSIQANDEIEFKVVLTNDYATGNVLYEANIVKRYNPTLIFVDNPDVDNLTNWSTSGGTWSTTTDSFSGTTAITSTASAPYSNNESKQIQMNGSLDLSGATTSLIQFYGKWDLERSFDYVQIEGSTNGTNWTPLCGKLTKPAAPNANNSYSGKGGVGSVNNNFQPDGEKLYDGDTQGKWNMEEVVVDASTNAFLFNQSTVFLRFDFKTDGSNREDSYVNVDFEGFTFDDFKVISIQAPCVSSVPTGLNASNITSSSAIISWDAIPGVEYDLRFKTSNSQVWEPIIPISTNTHTLTSLSSLKEYEVQVRSRCSGGTTSNFSSSILFTTLDVVLNYCSSASTNVNDEYISNVQLNTINNSSGAQFYSDFTSISTNLTKGTQYTITVTPTWTGTVYNESYAAWIDYNKDGDFSDPGEEVWTQGNTQATSVSGSFTISVNAVESSTRMRVTMRYNQIPGSCDTFTYGEVEDYTVIIDPIGPDITPPVITLIGATPINLDIGQTYVEQGAIATDNVDGDISNNIVIGGDTVNTNVVGTYVLTYNVNDSAGNAATEVRREVIVNPDVTAPVITLIGLSPINLNLGDTYIEPGATAFDNVDGDISGNVVIAGDTVDTNTLGTYIVTYNVDDLAGNAAVEERRIVNVNPISNGCSGGISTYPYVEGFEGTFGGWIQSSLDDLDWTIDANGTPSNGTGPSAAFEGSDYIYVEASGNGTGYPNKQAIITSPCFSLNSLSQAFFNFKYHMFGSADMGTIDLEISSDDGQSWNSIWSESGNNGNSWLTASIDISSYIGDNVQLRFNRVTGGIWQADIALDGFSLTDGAPPVNQCLGQITSYPYMEGFEGSIGAWTQSGFDDLNWTVDVNGTPSNGTGPSSAVEGNDYIYVEASGNGTGYPNKQAIIISPCFDLSNQGSVMFEFNYHMYGSTNAGTLDLEVSDDDGQSWASIWTETGNNGNSWFNKIIDLNAYAGSNIQLRFNRITGSTWQADVAIDGITLTVTPTTHQAIDNGQNIDVKPNIRLYPNPVNNTLNVVSKDFKPNIYKIFNKFNQIIFEGSFKEQIDVSFLKSGVYFLKLIDDNQVYVEQFIKR